MSRIRLLLLFLLLSFAFALHSAPAWAEDPAPPAAPTAAGPASADEPAAAPDATEGAAASGEAADTGAAGEEEVAPLEPSPWGIGLIASVAALTLGGLAAVLGIWVGRDDDRPVIFAMAMSVLIMAAIGVGMMQGYLDAVKAEKQKEDLDRMLGMVEEIAQASGDPALADVLKAEGRDVKIVPKPPAPPPSEGDDSGDAGDDGTAPADGAAPAEGAAGAGPTAPNPFHK